MRTKPHRCKDRTVKLESGYYNPDVRKRVYLLDKSFYFINVLFTLFHQGLGLPLSVTDHPRLNNVALD